VYVQCLNATSNYDLFYSMKCSLTQLANVITRSVPGWLLSGYVADYSYHICRKNFFGGEGSKNVDGFCW